LPCFWRRGNNGNGPFLNGPWSILAILNRNKSGAQ
jgi:hypothetical protein